MKDRVYASADKRWLFEKLVKSSDNKDGIFENNKDLIITASVIAYKSKQSSKLELKKDRIEIPLSVFRNTDGNIELIDIIALDKTKDVNILNWKDDEIVSQKLEIFEEYANKGLEILDQKLFQNNTDKYENLLQLISSELNNKETTTKKADLNSLIGSI
ncbi:DNA phosphorothioation-associated protein 4 [Aliarcobacter butzleri]